MILKDYFSIRTVVLVQMAKLHERLNAIIEKVAKLISM